MVCGTVTTGTPACIASIRPPIPAWHRKTVLTATVVFDSVEDRDGMLQSGMEEGAAETYDRLDEYLEVLKTSAAR